MAKMTLATRRCRAANQGDDNAELWSPGASRPGSLLRCRKKLNSRLTADFLPDTYRWHFVRQVTSESRQSRLTPFFFVVFQLLDM